jgi:hypothetical protein
MSQALRDDSGVGAFQRVGDALLHIYALPLHQHFTTYEFPELATPSKFSAWLVPILLTHLLLLKGTLSVVDTVQAVS